MEDTRKVCLTCNGEFAGDLLVCPKDGTALVAVGKEGLLGTVLGGRYELKEVIGDGAMGRVYKARHLLMKRTVAVKMMHPQLVSGKAALKRFQKEAELASALNHPNIMTVYDFGVAEDGSPYLVMDYLEGTPLNDLIKAEKHLPLSRAMHIFRQVCTGLAHAHDRGVIHRDLKPSNFMLVDLDGDSDFVKILDFGIAKQLNPSESAIDNLTRTGEVFGTPHYMSPEQCRAQEVDGRSDVYAIGCVIYETLCGYPPITGSDLIECLYKHVNTMPESFSVVTPELAIPPEVEAFVFKAMAKKPEDRFQTMHEMRAQIDILDPEGVTGLYSRVDVPALSAAEIRADADKNLASAAVSEGQTSEPAAVQASAEKKEPTDSKESPPGAPAPAARNKKPVLVAGLIVVVLGAIGTVIGLGNHKANLGGKSSSKMESCQKKAKEEYEAGHYALAKKQIREAMKIEDTENLPKNAENKYILGQVQYALGDYDDAEANFERAASIRRTNFGEQSLPVAEIEAAQGRAFSGMGNYKHAEELLDRAYKTRLKYLDAKDPLIADSVSGLADVYMRTKRYDEAIAKLKEALSIVEAKFGKASLQKATAVNNLAVVEQMAGHMSAADALFQEALFIRRNTLDKNSPAIAESLQSLGELYSQTGKYDQAIKYFKEAMVIQKQSMEANDPRIARTAQCYAAVMARRVHK